MTAGELLIGLATLGLAAATVWLAREARTTRVEAAANEQRRLLRAAIAEQLDDLRHWWGANPAHGDPALERIRRGEPQLEAAGRLLDQGDLPPDVAVYIVWIMGRIREEWLWWTTVISIGPSADESPAGNPANSAVGKWSMMVDRLQVLVAVIAGEASRRGYDELRGVHDAAPWVTVLEGPPRERELRWATDRARLGAPALPADPAFLFASPEARDRAGAATGERTKQSLLTSGRFG